MAEAYPVTYPDSWWSYAVNAVFYWPYRDNDVTRNMEYILPLGEHRYFRFNHKKDSFQDLVVQAGAAGVWVRNVSCYEAEDGTEFCEGFLEPKYANITLERFGSWLHATAIEVSLHPSGFIDEALQDMDDYLTMDYHTVHPIRLAAEDDILYPGSYYPVKIVYQGQKAGTYTKAPPVEAVATVVREAGMGFWQPAKIIEENSVTFNLRVGDEPTTPKELAKLLNADAAVVNLETLDPDSQAVFAAQYSGKTAKAAIVRFFGDAGEAAGSAGETLDKLIKVMEYTAIGALVLGGAYAALKAYPYVRDALDDVQGKKVRSGA